MADRILELTAQGSGPGTVTSHGSAIGISDTDATYVYRNDPVTFKFPDAATAYNYMKANPGALTVIFPLPNGDKIEQTFVSRTVEELAQLEKQENRPLGGFAAMLREMFATAPESQKYTDQRFLNLKDDETVKVMDTGERGDEFIEVPAIQFKRLLSLDMVDPCPACTFREKRPVAHPEGDFNMVKIKDFLDAEYPNAV